MTDKDFLKQLKDNKIRWDFYNIGHVKRLAHKGLATYVSEDFVGGWWELTKKGKFLIS